MASDGNGNGARKLLGMTFDNKFTAGTIAVLLVNLVGGAFVAGMIWNPVIETPKEIKALRALVDMRFDAVKEDFTMVRLQTAAITRLKAQQAAAAQHLEATDARVGELRERTAHLQADVDNIKAASGPCLAGDRRPECRAR